MTHQTVQENGSDQIKLQCVVVYIAEAHADDEWPISSARYNRGQEVHVMQSRTTANRVDQARDFFEKFGYSKLVSETDLENSLWKTVVSQPEEELGNDFGLCFEAQYKPWPFRAFGFVNNVIDFIIEPRECEIDIQQISAWLGENTLRSS